MLWWWIKLYIYNNANNILYHPTRYTSIEYTLPNILLFLDNLNSAKSILPGKFQYYCHTSALFIYNSHVDVLSAVFRNERQQYVTLT